MMWKFLVLVVARLEIESSTADGIAGKAEVNKMWNEGETGRRM
jgi:hypothetical protein